MPSGELSWSDKVYDIYAVPTATSLSIAVGLANYTAQSAKRLANYIEEAKKGHSFSDEFDFYDAKGNYKRVISRGSPVLDPKGDVSMIQGTIKDITDTFFEAQRNSLAIEAGHIGVWEYDHLENNLVTTELRHTI